MAKGSLTARPTARAGAKAGHSDPAVTSGSAVAQRIKGTPGITGLSFPRVHIDGKVWHLDVGSSHPGAGVGPKGWAVRPLKRHAGGFCNVASQFGPCPLCAQETCEGLSLVREDRDGRTSGVPVVPPGAWLVGYVRSGYPPKACKGGAFLKTRSATLRVGRPPARRMG